MSIFKNRKRSNWQESLLGHGKKAGSSIWDWTKNFWKKNMKRY